jgi:hypothetical protein
MRARSIAVIGIALLSVCGWLGAQAMRGQSQDVGDAARRAQQVPGQEPPQEGPVLPNGEKKTFEDNDKDMKKKVNRLYELATELKAEVDKTDSSKVLSLNLLRKAEEIEKLARDIKNKGKG